MQQGKDQGSEVRDRILATARELFYREGIRAVGVDTIVERSNVAKTSLYRHFENKDRLIAAFLSEEDREFWKQWDKVAAECAGDPRRELRSHLAWLRHYIQGPNFRGCPFIKASAEFADAEHPGRLVCRANKAELLRRLTHLATGAGASDPEALGEQLVLLIEGAFASSEVLGKAGPAQQLERAGAALITAAIAP